MRYLKYKYSILIRTKQLFSVIEYLYWKHFTIFPRKYTVNGDGIKTCHFYS